MVAHGVSRGSRRRSPDEKCNGRTARLVCCSENSHVGHYRLTPGPPAGELVSTVDRRRPAGFGRIMRKLDIQGLTMSFGPVRAVDNVSLQVDEGETVVLL